MERCAWCFALPILASLATLATGQDPAIDKSEALKWLDRFAVDQALFDSADVQSLRDRVAAMSPAEAAAWWQDFSLRREMLDDPSWTETNAWLRQYLRVQAVYSDQQIREFRAQAFAKVQESARGLKEVQDEITARRMRVKSESQMSHDARQRLLASTMADLEVGRRIHEAGLMRPARVPMTSGPVVTRNYARRYYYPPLINSYGVAQWAVFRQVFPRW